MERSSICVVDITRIGFYALAGSMIAHSAHAPTITFPPSAPELHIDLIQSSSAYASINPVYAWVHDMGAPTQLLTNLGLTSLVLPPARF